MVILRKWELLEKCQNTLPFFTIRWIGVAVFCRLEDVFIWQVIESNQTVFCVKMARYSRFERNLRSLALPSPTTIFDYNRLKSRFFCAQIAWFTTISPSCSKLVVGSCFPTAAKNTGYSPVFFWLDTHGPAPCVITVMFQPSTQRAAIFEGRKIWSDPSELQSGSGCIPGRIPKHLPAAHRYYL